MPYLHIHRNRYYYKRKIPNTQFNIVVSLQTDSLTTAKNLLAIINAKTLALFQRLKKGEYMDVQKIKSMINDYIQEAIKEYGSVEELRHKVLTIRDDGKTYSGHSEKAIEKALGKFDEILMSGDNVLIKEEALKVLKRSTISQDQYNTLTVDEQKVFHFELLKGEVNVLHYDNTRNKKRLTEGLNTTYETSFSAFNPQNTTSNLASTKSLNPRDLLKSISEIADDFLFVKRNTKEPFRYKRDIDIFMCIVDKKYLCDITHEDYDRYLSDIQYLPPENTNKQLFSKNSIVEVLEISKQDKSIIKIKSETLKRKILNVNAFINFAISRGYVSENLLKSKTQYVDYDTSDAVPRTEYRMEQLHNLFYVSKWYTTQFDKNFRQFPSRIWLPLMLLYNGFRLNEAAQLYLDQIVKRDGVWMFRIAIDYEEQRLKNPESKRTIPIHPKLIELGFLKYYNQQVQSGHTRLFEDLYFTKDKGYGQAFSKVFNENKFRLQWLEEETIKKIEDKIIKLDAHSFRHTFVSSITGIVKFTDRESLIGHKVSDSNYGSMRPKVAYNHISKCEYEFDLAPLSEKLNEVYRNYEIIEDEIEI